MDNKKRIVKYLALSLLVFILFMVILNIYSNILKSKLTDQVMITLEEVVYQNKMVVENQISKQKKVIEELAFILNSEEALINDHVLESISEIYKIGDYKNIGIVTPKKTVYISSDGKFITKEENYFKNFDDKNSLFVVDNDIVDGIFISELVTSNDGEKG